jgi:hypothetical protein
MKLIVTGSGELKVIAKAKGLGAGCEGETLHVVVSVRESTDGCSSGDPLGCTVIDVTDLPLNTFGFGFSCLVTGGVCTVNATLPNGAWFSAGQESGVEFLGFGLKRFSTVNSPAALGRTLSAGILVP